MGSKSNKFVTEPDTGEKYRVEFRFVDYDGSVIETGEYLPKGIYEVNLYEEYKDLVQGYTNVDVGVDYMPSDGSWDNAELDWVGYVYEGDIFTIEVKGEEYDIVVSVQKDINWKILEENTGAIQVETHWEVVNKWETYTAVSLGAEVKPIGEHLLDIDLEVEKSNVRREPDKVYKVKTVTENGVDITEDYLLDGTVNVEVLNKEITRVNIDLEEVK